ncbi:MAG: T9SS type A sorting domain-containing protein [Chitinophagaceae bacterium]|nr:T9SS type A sorting domain-containing protein [Chitinophagaceae bacterium]
MFKSTLRLSKTRIFVFVFLFIVCASAAVKAQINYSANEFGRVPAYNSYFQYGSNMGYYGPSWDNNSLSDIASGNASRNIPGVGSMSYRIPLPEEFLDYWGYDVAIGQFNHYAQNGATDHTIFLTAPSAGHRDMTRYNGCGESTWMWQNMYSSIWDGGANGTPVNENNYYALYVYKTVLRYGNFVRFWEILNEPDFDTGGNGWKAAGQPGNWWENLPTPCDLYNMRAPIFHYIRLLRISYEVIKFLKPNDYITVGGLGTPSFLDLILRLTDNPAGGAVSAEFPLKGGAYFDVLSYHSYPMYALEFWDNSINNFGYKRHSDAAADEFIKVKTTMEQVLFSYGYNNSLYPLKHVICTENNIPRREFGTYIGSDVAQRNYVMKALVQAQVNNIRQYYIFTLGDGKTPAEAGHAYEVMGLYSKLEGVGPIPNNNYGQQYNQSGVGFRTTSEILRNHSYDRTRSTAMNLPAGIAGGAFRDTTGQFVYVLWVKTTVDKVENASATYTFPAAMNIAPLMIRKEWDFSTSRAVASIPSSPITLTASPIFLTENLQVVPLREGDSVRIAAEKKLALQIYPNPASKLASLKFTLTAPARVTINIFDVDGRLVKSVPTGVRYGSGTHIVPINGIAAMPAGVYYCRFETEIVQIMKKLTITR